MNDQSFMHSVGDTFSNHTPSDAQDSARIPADPNRKRFRRGGGHQPTGTEIVAQYPGSSRDMTEKAPSVRKGTALAPFRTLNPVQAARDEWDALRLLPSGVRRHFVSGAPLVNFFRNDPAAKAFDLLRTRLIQTLRTNGWSRIAIASPTHGCGSTFTAVNLAQSLSRIPGSRTVLMDVNHRKPGIARMLDIDCIGDMRGYLAGDVPMDRHLMRLSKTLAVGLASEPDNDAAEILHDARCGETLERMSNELRPDVVLYDLPPILAYDDAAAFLPQVDGVLLVADGTRTVSEEIAACERVLDGQTQVLGVILNRARTSGSKEYDT